MKKINTLLYTLLAGFMTLLATGANAQTWNFANTSSEDEANLKADAQNWEYDETNNRYKNVNPINGALTANGQTLELTDGLLFSVDGKDYLRIDIDKRIALNKTGEITILGLKAGQVVTVEGTSSNKNEGRSITAENLVGTTNFGVKATSATTLTCTGTVEADGNVTVTNPEGGFYFYSIKVQDAGEVTPPASNYNDVSLNTAKNQMRLTIGNEVKYYNTDDVKVAFDRSAGTVIVTPNAGTWQDVYTKSVSNIDFSLAQPTGGEGEIQEGEIKIIEAKGWQESLYAKWEKYDGASSYNVYVKGGQYSDWTKIDQQLVRDYGSYARADVVGLVAGDDYAIKVVGTDNEGNELTETATEATNMEVVNYVRGGYAHFNATEGIGAYNNDGSLKKNAVVLYITNDNINTITCDISTGKSLETRTGLGDILQAFEKGAETRPFAIRFIGQIKDVESGQLMGEANSMQIKGKDESTKVNVTFEGIGDDATLYGWGITMAKVGYVEIRNLAVMLFSDDGIQLKGAGHIWVHNNDFFYGNVGSDSDQAKGDGSLDTKDSGSYNTFSFNHFWDSGKCSLCGMKSEKTDDYETYHHNWFDHADSRCPRVRTKTIHVYNNYYDGVSKYGVGATMGSSVFVENNYFRNTNKPMMISLQGSDIAGGGDGTFSGEDGGMIKSYGNVFAEKSNNFRYVTYQDDNVEFDAYEATSRNENVPSSVKAKVGETSYNNFDTNSSLIYQYEVDNAADVPGIVTGFYGAGRLNHGDFKWSFNNSVDDSDYEVNTELKNKIVNYKTSLVSIYGDENAESGEQGSEGGTTEGGETGGETGGDSGEGTETPDTPVIEGTVTCSFNGSVSNDAFIAEKEGKAPSFTDKGGPVTVDGVSYEKGLKVESATTLTFTTSETMTMIIYLGTASCDNLKLDGETITVNDSANNTITVTVNAGNHTISRGQKEGHIYFIKLIPVTE